MPVYNGAILISAKALTKFGHELIKIPGIVYCHQDFPDKREFFKNLHSLNDKNLQHEEIENFQIWRTIIHAADFFMICSEIILFLS